MKPCRHLQQEIKGEMDRATGKVRQAEDLIMEMEFEYNERINSIARGPEYNTRIVELTRLKELRQENIGIEKAYNTQNKVVRRFDLLNHVYKIACVPAPGSIVLRNAKEAICKNYPDFAAAPDADEIVKSLVSAIADYLNGSLDDENDRRIRRAWDKVERFLSM